MHLRPDAALVSHVYCRDSGVRRDDRDQISDMQAGGQQSTPEMSWRWAFLVVPIRADLQAHRPETNKKNGRRLDATQAATGHAGGFTFLDRS